MKNVFQRMSCAQLSSQIMTLAAEPASFKTQMTRVVESFYSKGIRLKTPPINIEYYDTLYKKEKLKKFT